jgi:hypothetical protein
MKTTNLIFIIFLKLLIASSGYAQSNNACPDNASQAQNDSKESLEFFLNSDDYESTRSTINLTNVEDKPIELLSGSNVSCSELNTYESQHVSNKPNTHYTYYKVSNYYFMVSWFSVNTTRNINILIFDEQYNIFHAILL